MPEVPRGSPEAARAIWNWRGRQRACAPSTSLTRIRIRGSCQAAFGLGIGAAFLLLRWPILAYGVIGVSTLVLIGALASPAGVYAGLERVLRAAGRPVGHGVTWLFLSLLFYFFFVPFGFLFRRGSRDRLNRSFDAQLATYWEAHEGGSLAASHYRDRLY